MRVDSHHHLWHYTAQDFGWITDSMAALRRDFLLDALQNEIGAANVDGTVVVQARQSIGETRWLLALAESSPILGVVGWAPLTDPDFPDLLDELRQNRWLKGLRHIVQAEPDEFLARADFNRGIARLTETGLVYDLLIYARQMPQAISFVDRHPDQAFVLDHLGKPDVLHEGSAAWSKTLREIARRPNVACKLSGLVTEADPSAWTEQQLRPYLDRALEAFGAERLMIGTDWPVCTVGCTYAGWWALVERWASALSQAERDALLGGTARRIYHLDVPKGMGRTSIDGVRA